ncbi:MULTISPECIES: DHA2 family efflux MFS transporter permease subunit [unclassified Herbaspirillum]|jgi:DHA2 family multidrug resistance protein|uniref:DHA2 family efflux MFS transporter permease subunit n=1 Tax=unclassified Herbaspirillum TaxID=2624150 RepID=UPI000E2EA85E|nr:MULTISPECIES: DHA2 family efflux MFS transporter permease subunit [unclassified Herbaspirillum]RFB73359.1 DHA2 family efflux MFS transporter permease subunit [Herbaspirillum sp. 3R-3a1]TFI10837.1 DHA2 family efflux MFS transporter permease subunit [Herbaspirillum sp. 3R11]TFI16744.1 DHA2 family efflux MFS transporter permease subunit [Herbaspirillum sp. 3R-11]TFI29326.1 DHA2 family efflux MFS transporter permease subunit [Herbaspirillum sp. 3C11]
MASSPQTYTPPPPLTGGKLVLGTLCVSLAVFMNVLDSSIANVAIPTISGNLGVSIDEGTWVITSFAAANAISIPLTGWLTQRIGAVRLFVSSVLLFVLASWLCGLAPTLPILLGARVLQGLVAGPMVPLSQSLLLGAYPKSKASFALALWGMTAVVAPVAGPALGGWITDAYKWPWIFYINIPVGLLAAGMTMAIYKDRESPTHKLPIDTIGLLLLITWVAAFQIMLDKGKDLDWFASPTIVTLGIIAAVAFAYFVIWELNNDHPVVDLRLFGRRNFFGGTVAISIGYGVFFGNLVLLPQWLQQYLGYRSIDSGLSTAPIGIFAVILMPLIGKFLPRMDARKVATASFVGFACVFFMRSHYNLEVDQWTVILPTLLQGIPTAMFFVPLTVLLLSGLPPERIPAAAGLSSFVRVFCGAIGTSVATTAWNNRTIVHHAQLTEHATPYSTALQQMFSNLTGSFGMSTEQATGLIERNLNAQAAMIGINDIFWLSGVIFLVIIPVIWIIKPAKGNAGAEAAAAAH